MKKILATATVALLSVNPLAAHAATYRCGVGCFPDFNKCHIIINGNYIGTGDLSGGGSLCVIGMSASPVGGPVYGDCWSNPLTTSCISDTSLVGGEEVATTYSVVRDASVTPLLSGESAASAGTFTVSVSGVSTATGWGAHFSPSRYSDGYGGTASECYLRPDGANVVAECYDSYINTVDHHIPYSVNLGLRVNIENVSFNVSASGVEVSAVAKTNQVTYTPTRRKVMQTAVFPLRSVTPYVSGPLYFKSNGTLQSVSGRTGSGYTVAVTMPVAGVTDITDMLVGDMTCSP